MIQLDSTEARKFAVHLEGYEGLGGELVKNGDFSEIGADVVENGAFDELGADVITDGNFTATGSDLITNGDFSATGAEMDTLPSPSSPALSHYRFEPYGANTIGYDGSGITTITYEDNSSGGYHYLTGEYNLNDGATPLYLVEGTSYQISITTKINSGTYDISLYPGYGGGIIIANDISNTDYVTTTSYFTYGGESNAFIRCIDIGTGQVVSINNVSVKELGADWTVEDGWSVGDSKAVFDDTQTNYIAQNSPSFEIGKSYKIQFEIGDCAGTCNVHFYNRSHSVVFIANENWTNGTYTRYVTPTVNSEGFAIWGNTALDSFSITNIIVQELGEDWTQGNGWTIGDSKAISAQALGGELITNGDFSATTNITIANYNFATEDMTGWTLGSTLDGVTPYYSDGGALISNGPLNGNSNIAQSTIFEVGKSYKVSYRIVSNANTNKLNLQGYGALDADVATHTIYIVGVVTRENLVIKRSNADTSIVITDIVVEELGEGWSVGDKWSLSDEGARLVSSTSDASLVTQTNVFEIGKSYKVTLDAVVNSGTAKLEKVGGAVQFLIDTTKTYVEYFEATQTTFNLNRYTSVSDIYINNISVEEIATSYLTQAGVLTADKTWKVIYSAVVSAGTVSATEWGAVTSATATVTDYVQVGTTTDFRMVNIDGYFEGSVTGISANLVDPNGYWTLEDGWSFGEDKATANTTNNLDMYQDCLAINKTYKVSLEVSDLEVGGKFYVCDAAFSDIQTITTNGTNVVYFSTTNSKLNIRGKGYSFSVTNISVQELDPNEYWSLGTGWSIGDLKALYDGSAVGYSWIDQNIGATLGKTYRVDFNAVVTSGSFQVKMGSVDADASDENTTISGTNTYSTLLVSGGSSGVGIYGVANAGNFVGSITDIAIRLKNTGAVTLTLINQLTEKETIVDLTPLASNGRYTEFSYQPTGLIEGMYLIKFTGDSTTYAETLAYITTGTPPLGESEYTEYTTGDDNPDYVYIP